MINKLQRKLDSMTMYKVVIAGLSLLAGFALFLSALGVLTYAPTTVLAGMLALLLVVCYLSNLVLGKLYKIPTNQESSAITALILFFVLGAPSEVYEWIGVALAGLLAIASKYILTYRGANIFNPAAWGVFVVSLVGVGFGAWWLAREELFIPMVIIGALVLMKLRRFELFFAFLVPALLLIVFRSLSSGEEIWSALIGALTLYPLIFLGAIMLTEPGTMPGTRNKRLVYGVIVGLLAGSQLEFGPFSTSPHEALLAGNLFTLAATRRSSARLKFVGKKQISATNYDFAFESDRPAQFIPGQYIELTMPAGTKTDIRGNRRTFTIASPPEENLLHFGIKINSPGSWFKEKLMSLKPGDEILGNHIGGDFRLPKDSSTPLVFVAGGIGITPFISMIKSMLQRDKTYDATLYYFVRDESEVAYKDVLTKAKAIGIKVHIRTGRGARLTEEDVLLHPKAHFYLSGPPAFVSSYKSMLASKHVKKIYTDFFTGY